MINYFRLNKFLKAHKFYYTQALAEIQKGEKKTHWIWYIFPQLKGLGKSYMSNYYGLKNKAEALAFYKNKTLGSHLIEITNELLRQEESDIVKIVGETDALKIRSCMTLFYEATNDEIFLQVIEKYYNRIPCVTTVLKVRKN